MSSEAKPAESYVEKPKTLAELRAGIATGRTKATELAASYYERIEKKNPRLNAYLCLTKERAIDSGDGCRTIWRSSAGPVRPRDVSC